MNLRCLALPLSLLLTIATSHAVDAEGVTEDRKNAHALKPAERKGDTTPADSAAAAQKGFRRAKIPAGFKADLWAAEPLLANPVAFSFDGKGRMFIAETHRYRTSVLDIRHYMFMLEDDLANRNQADWERSIKKNFPNDWQELGRETEVVRLVEDTDGDGKADKSGVYADGFNSILDGIASGVLARPDGVWVTNIPGLYKLSGLGADGKAEKKEEVFRGFGVRFSYTGHDLHGLIKGPDGRLYFSIGDRGASVKTKEGGTIEVPDEGAIFRCEEDGSHLELVMRGLRNPQELAFDDYGNLFTCDNDSDQGDRERLVYVVEGGDAGWRVGYQHCPQPAELNPWLAEHMWEPRDPAKNQPASILSPVANLPDGPGGLVHYPGTGLPEKYNGCFFLACYKGSSATSQVAVFKPVPDGAGFKLEMLETFIPGCQATDVDFGPDSRLYVSFWDEGWERTAQGRIMKVEHEEARKAQAAQIAEVQKLLGEGMKNRSAEELVKLLGHKDQRVRLEAQWELTDRGLKGDQNLNRLLKLWPEWSLLQKLHVVWAIQAGIRKTDRQILRDGRVGEKPEEALSYLTKEPAPVIVAILRAIRDFPADQFSKENSRTVAFVASRLIRSDNAEISREALLTLGAFGDSSELSGIYAKLRQTAPGDQYMLHAAVRAITGIVHRSLKSGANYSMLAIWEFADEPVKQALVLASAKLVQRQMQELDATVLPGDALELLKVALGDRNPVISSEAARLINVYQIDALDIELAKIFRYELTVDPMTAIRSFNSCLRAGGKTNGAWLANAIMDEDNGLPVSVRIEGLAILAQWENPSPRDRVSGMYRPVKTRNLRDHLLDYVMSPDEGLALTDPTFAVQLLETIGQLKIKQRDQAVYRLVNGLSEDPGVRVKGLQTLSVLEYPKLPDALQKATTDPSSTVRIAAAGLLGKTDAAAAAKALESALAQGTAEDARAAFVELAALSGAEADRIVAEQLAALAAGKVPAIAKLELLEAAAKREAPAVKEALAKYEAALPQNDVVAKFAACLEGGDKEAGRKLYNEHPVAACKRCHMINHSGGEAGPALDGIGAKDRRYLLESIIVPNAQIAETFRMVVCNLKDGTVKTGVLRGETVDSVTIQTPGEEPETIKTADIATRDAVPSGMMPGLDVLLTKRELRDLVEYLASLKTDPGSAPKSGK